MVSAENTTHLPHRMAFSNLRAADLNYVKVGDLIERESIFS